MPEPFALRSTSPRHELPYLHPGQAQKEFFVNEALARIDALLHATVIDERAEPPAGPQPGDAYLIAAGATGEWLGEDGAIAVSQGSHWLFLPPVDGASLRRIDTGQVCVYSNGWSTAMEPGAPSGGTTVDTEARAAIAGLIGALRHSGVFPKF